jgi:hypothetical protein
MNPATPPSSQEQAPPPSSENSLEETGTPPLCPISPHSAEQAQTLQQELEAALNEPPDDIDSVVSLLDALNQKVARLLEQKTGLRPPAPPTLDADDVLLSCTVTLRDRQGVFKHLDVSAPMYGVLADSELAMAHNTLNAVMSMLIIRPLSTAWTQHVSSRVQRPPMLLSVKVDRSVHNSGVDDELSPLEKLN